MIARSPVMMKETPAIVRQQRQESPYVCSACGAVSLKKAFELMRKPGTRLVKMFTRASPEGFAHYVLPGGYVSSATAEKIKQHPLVYASKDGLFPGHDQTWRLGDG